MHDDANNEKNDESNELTDTMTKTSSYGAMGNEQLDGPPVHVNYYFNMYTG